MTPSPRNLPSNATPAPGPAPSLAWSTDDSRGTALPLRPPLRLRAGGAEAEGRGSCWGRAELLWRRRETE